MELCWMMVQLVHQIFTRGSAISAYFYYLVFIHQSSSIKCESPSGYLLLGTKSYWKIPSISPITMLEQIENMLSGQTQYDCLSENLMSLAAKPPLSHLMLRKSPDSFFFSFDCCLLPYSPQLIEHPQSYCARLYHQICSCFYCCWQ